MEEKICCFTGYRPSKFPFSLNSTSKEYNEMENNLLNTINDLISEGYTTFYSGMAMGFDIIAAEAVLLSKQNHPEKEIKLVCALPFIDQIEIFEESWKSRHTDIIRQADEIIVLMDKYAKGCYMERNKLMVDRSDAVVTWYDGHTGGTHNTLLYAAKKGKFIINLKSDIDYDYSEFEAYTLLEEETI